jgi:hypothetical protein
MIKNNNTVAVNRIAAGDYMFNVNFSQRPYGNNFIVEYAKVVEHNGQDEVYAVVTCTLTSKDAGRQYCCTYSTTGELIGCYNV